MPKNDYFEDGPDQAAAANSSATETKPEEKHDEGKTALIDSAVCEGLEPGDELHLRVVKTLDKEYLVEYQEDEGKDEKPPESDSQQPEAAMAEGGGNPGGGLYE